MYSKKVKKFIRKNVSFKQLGPLISKGYTYIAFDGDGDCYIYTERPVFNKSDDIWGGAIWGGAGRASLINSKLPRTLNPSEIAPFYKTLLIEVKA